MPVVTDLILVRTRKQYSTGDSYYPKNEAAKAAEESLKMDPKSNWILQLVHFFSRSVRLFSFLCSGPATDLSLKK